jgi:hypothetical protein
MRTDGRTEMTKLIVVFRNFSKEPKHTETKQQLYYPTISIYLYVGRAT